MPKTQRSETKWKSPAITSKRDVMHNGRMQTAVDVPSEGAAYVLQHATEEPDRIRLCVGGSQVLLSLAMLDALIADLTDARGSIPCTGRGEKHACPPDLFE